MGYISANRKRERGCEWGVKKAIGYGNGKCDKSFFLPFLIFLLREDTKKSAHSR